MTSLRACLFGALRRIAVVFEHDTYAIGSTQVVAGTNFFFKIKVADNKFMHAKVFRSLPHAGLTLSRTALQTDKSESDELQYF